MTCAHCGEGRVEQQLPVSLGSLGTHVITQLSPCACVRRTLAFLAQPVSLPATNAQPQAMPVSAVRRRRVSTQEDEP